MLLAHSRNGAEVFASEAWLDQAPYRCPHCGGIVERRRDTQGQPYFAHRRNMPCRHGEDELPSQMFVKLELFKALSRNPEVTDCRIEHKIGDLVSDVYFECRSYPVAVMVQLRTPVDILIRHRLEQFTAHGVYTLYLVPEVSGRTLSAPLGTRYLHCMFRHNLFSWYGGDLVTVWHLDKYRRSPWNLSWTEQLYRQPRRIFRYATPVPLTAFAPMIRRAEESGDRHLGIVDAWLWSHQLGQFWEPAVKARR